VKPTEEHDSYEEQPVGRDSDSDLAESLMFESNGFDKDALDEAIEQRKKHLLNKHLTKMEKEIYLAIKYGDSNKLRDLGGGE
jgi:DNA-directed RNA polymerase sigma subunit (sigma70/sigma32)